MDVSRRSRSAATADARTEAVRRFYERAPFPGYPPRDSLHALRVRAERSAFVRLLDRALPGDARIVEMGCGTGQMSLYLARADRLVVGVYNAFARLPSRLRRVVARLSGYRVVPFDPVLRERQAEPARREAWLRDQYQHPEEHRHTLAEVQRWFSENDVEYVRSYPSAVLGDEPEDLFAPAVDNWTFEGWLAQLGWMRTLGREGGLFFTIGRRT